MTNLMFYLTAIIVVYECFKLLLYDKIWELIQDIENGFEYLHRFFKRVWIIGDLFEIIILISGITNTSYWYCYLLVIIQAILYKSLVKKLGIKITVIDPIITIVILLTSMFLSAL